MITIEYYVFQSRLNLTYECTFNILIKIYLVYLFLSICNRFATNVLDFPRGSLRKPRPLNSP